MSLDLQEKQSIAFLTPANEILYGGSAFGGKSYWERVSDIRWCLEIAGIQVYLFRRTLPDLRDNHLRGPTSFFVMLDKGLQSGQIKYRAQENEFFFPNDSVLHLCYCDSENDVEKYRGAEIHVLSKDELTHFTEYQYRFLRSRVRIAGLKIPDKYAGDREYVARKALAQKNKDVATLNKISEFEREAVYKLNTDPSYPSPFPRLPRVETASNPGSIGHAWVKRTFVSPKRPFEIWRAPPEEGGMLRQFIPARMEDNPAGLKDDPSYADRLRGLGANDLVRAMLDGDWDIIACQAFEKLRRETHCLEPFEIPEDWLRFGSLDWGSARPFSYGMWAVANDPHTVGKITIQRGAMVRYDEWYGWNGKPNEGLRMEAPEVARGILAKEDGVKPAYRIADSSMWKVDGGPSIAETFNKHGCILRPSPKGPGSRHNGYVEVRARIAGNEDGPMLFATQNCHSGFWRTMPDQVMDEHQFGIKSEQISTDQEDHVSDDVMYACTSRPWMRHREEKRKPVDRWMRFEEKENRSWRII